MAANFNLKFVENIEGSGFDGIEYVDPQGNRVLVTNPYYSIKYLQNIIAPFWKKQTYAANSLVWQYGELYYNPNAINTAENWIAAHWTKTTLADYIKLMTT